MSVIINRNIRRHAGVYLQGGKIRGRTKAMTAVLFTVDGFAAVGKHVADKNIGAAVMAIVGNFVS